MSNENNDWFYSSDQFQAFFKSSSRSMVVKANAPRFTILAVSDVYLAMVHLQRSDLLNKDLFTVFPGYESEANERSNIINSLQRVIAGKAADVLPVYKYDIFMPETGRPETQYWSAISEPVTDDTGEVAYIIRTTTNITNEVNSTRWQEEVEKQKEALYREQALNEELAAANEELSAVNEELHQAQESLYDLNNELEQRISSRTKELVDSEARLRSIFEQAPLAFYILNGPDQIVEFANDRMLALWHKTADVIGKPYAAVRPEPEAVAFLKLIKEVYTTGVPFTGNEVKAHNAYGNGNRWGYFSFTYQALRDENDSVTGVLGIVDDVTETVLARTQKDRVNIQLRLAVEAARIGSWQIEPETKALEYDDTLARIFGYEGDEKMTYDAAIAQVTDDFRSQISSEIEKAIAGGGGNYDITYSQRRFNDGEIIWLRSLGKITKDENGEYTVFSGVVMDITGSMKSRQQIEEAEGKLKLAILSANMGTWSADLLTNQLIISDKTKEIHGIPLHDSLTLTESLDMIHPEHQQRVQSAITAAIEQNKPFSEEYIISPMNGSSDKWLKSTGIVNYSSNGQPVNVSGTILDITEQKRDDQRKNDFIGMVSHEMKTPLTSMSVYIQLLQLNAKKKEDSYTGNLLEKASRQVGKMTTLINGFLNVSRLESGKINIDKQRFDMAVLIKESEEEAGSTILSHRVVFHPVESIYVNADKDKIGQVISNLISNAIKYSAGGTSIRVACIVVDGMLQVSVQDEGMGIRQEDIDKLFERYYRVTDDHTKQVAGFGIGLYLCSEVIQRHDGKIWVESEWGKGSTFYFTLPLSQSDYPVQS